jgi:hypothetical protein
MSDLFSFNLNNKLTKILPKKLKIKNYKHIHTIFYYVKVCNNIPYLLILFEKKSDKKLHLPSFNNNISFDKNINKIKKNIKNIGNKVLNIIDKPKFTLQGSLEQDSELFIFYNCKNLADIYTYKVNDKFYWCSLFEIINFQKCLKYKFFQNHLNFIVENNEIFLFKLNEKPVAIPVQIYLELNNNTNIIKLLNNFDNQLQKKFIEHTNNIVKNKKIIRCLLFDNEFEVIGKKIFYDNSNNFIIISIFE